VSSIKLILTNYTELKFLSNVSFTFLWIIQTLVFMSLTMARSERVRSVLTHANCTRFIF